MDDRIINGLTTGATALLFGLSAILLAGCSSEGPQAEAVTSLVADSSTAVPDEARPDDSTSSTTVPAAVAPPEPAQFVPDASSLAEDAPLEPGTYRVDTLGTPMSFTVEDPSFVHPNSHGQFVLAHPGSRGPGDRGVLFFRLSHLVDPSDPTMVIAPETFFETHWPSDDFGGWLDNLSADVVVTDRFETTVGGRLALRADLKLVETTCGPGAFDCALLGTNMLYVRKYMAPGEKVRVWIVDQDDQDPLAIVASINRDGDESYFDTADSVVSTLAFGEIGPNRVEYAPPGPVEEAGFLGGIRAELAEEGMRFREPLARISVLDTPAEIAFFTNPLDLDGVLLATTDQLVAALESVDAKVTELDPVTMGGLDARVFDLGVRSWQPALKILPGAEAIWEIPPRARGWVVEHPDRGLLMITAEAFRDIDAVFPVVLAQTEAIVDSLEFVDLEGGNGPSATDLNGTWVRSNGVTWIIEDGMVSVTGGAVDSFNYSATGTTIDLIDVSCGPTRPGMYGWTIADDVLSLVLMTDECEGRSDALDGASFERTD